MTVPTDEAMNINRFGTYAFFYGIVLLSVFLGLLATAVILEVPPHGAFGTVTVLRFVLRIVAILMLGLAAYSFYCYRHSNGITRLRPSFQIFSWAILFAVLGIEW